MTSPAKNIQRERKHGQPHSPRVPTYFFVGRQDLPPYAWAYGDNEMRASNIMWIIQEVIDDKDLEEVYLREIDFGSKSRGARTTRAKRGTGRKRRKGLSGGIIDLSISETDEEEDHTNNVLDVRPRLKSSLSNPARSVGSPAISCSNSSAFTAGPRSNQHIPVIRHRPIANAVDGKSVPELRGVFVGPIHALSS